MLEDKNSQEQLSEGANDSQLMQEMLAQMKKLTDEVNVLRKQLQEITALSQATQYDSTEVGYSDIASDYDGDAETNENPIDSQELTTQKQPSRSVGKKNNALSIITNIVFYALIISLVFGAFLIRSSKNGRPWMVGGYSAMTVLTSSMEDVYPKGSLIITKSVDPDKLKIGDDITYMTNETTSITHRIIGITENYLDTNERGFETQGVMNDKPDKEIVSAGNVVGRVIFCSKTLGDIATFIAKNWPFLLFFVFVIVILLAFLKWNASRTEKNNNSKDDSIETNLDSHTNKNINKKWGETIYKIIVLNPKI